MHVYVRLRIDPMKCWHNTSTNNEISFLPIIQIYKTNSHKCVCHVKYDNCLYVYLRIKTMKSFICNDTFPTELGWKFHLNDDVGSRPQRHLSLWFACPYSMLQDSFPCTLLFHARCSQSHRSHLTLHRPCVWPLDPQGELWCYNQTKWLINIMQSTIFKC